MTKRTESTGKHYDSLAPRFNTVVIDPPWPISMTGKFKVRPHRATELPYHTMTLEEIKKLRVSDHLNTGAHVYLWCTNKTLRDAYDVLDAWGIRFHQVLVMTKPGGMAPSLGYRFSTEFCLLGIYGRPMQKFTHMGASNHFSHTPKPGSHSSKPDYFYELVERMSPGPYADIFARRKRSGWQVWGDEVEKDFDIPTAPG